MTAVLLAPLLGAFAALVAATVREIRRHSPSTGRGRHHLRRPRRIRVHLNRRLP